MDIDLSPLVHQFQQVVAGIYNSSLVFGIKFFLAIYVTVLFVDLILLLSLRGVTTNLRVMMKGMDIPTISKGKLQRNWDKIKARLMSDNASQYKVAVLEADRVADQMLEGIGYKGENMAERLKNITAVHVGNVDDLLRAHDVRNQIIHDPNFVLDKKTATELVGVYENFLRSMEFL